MYAVCRPLFQDAKNSPSRRSKAPRLAAWPLQIYLVGVRFPLLATGDKRRLIAFLRFQRKGMTAGNDSVWLRLVFSSNGGEGGIRTHGTVSRTLAFEASTLNRSVTSPRFASFHPNKGYSFRQSCARRAFASSASPQTPRSGPNPARLTEKTGRPSSRRTASK
jgi:hypothetical protein